MQVICEKAGECGNIHCLHSFDHVPGVIYACSSEEGKCDTLRTRCKCIPVTEEGEKP